MPTVSVIGTLPPVKGLSAYTLEFCRAMARHWAVDFVGFRKLYPEFLYPGGTVDPAARPVRIEGVDQRHLLSWSNPASWVQAGSSLRGDLVHAQWWSYVLAPVYWTVLSSARRRGLPIVVTVHNVAPHEEGAWRGLLNRSVLRLADALIVHSEANRRTLLDRFRFPPEAVHVVPHGILRPEGPLPSRQEARAFLGIGPEVRMVLFFGNIRQYKGVDTLIAAFNALDVPHKHLFIVGQCWEGRHRYDRLIDKHPAIHFHDGFVAEKQAALYARACDLMVLPYRRFDSASGVGGFALPFHVPLIVSDVGSLPDLVKDREHCVMRPDDGEDLCRKMTRILMDPVLREKLRQEAAQMEAAFGWDGIAERTVAIYEHLLSFKQD